MEIKGFSRDWRLKRDLHIYMGFSATADLTAVREYSLLQYNFIHAVNVQYVIKESQAGKCAAVVKNAAIKDSILQFSGHTFVVKTV